MATVHQGQPVHTASTHRLLPESDNINRGGGSISAIVPNPDHQKKTVGEASGLPGAVCLLLMWQAPCHSCHAAHAFECRLQEPETQFLCHAHDRNEERHATLHKFFLTLPGGSVTRLPLPPSKA